MDKCSRARYTARKAAEMKTTQTNHCPRCFSDTKAIKQRPYRNPNMLCRNGWHNVGTRTMPRYVRALGSSPLNHVDFDSVALPIVKAADNISIKEKLQSVYNLCCLDGRKLCLDIANKLGIELKQ